jgi:hypothetical protein
VTNGQQTQAVMGLAMTGSGVGGLVWILAEERNGITPPFNRLLPLGSPSCFPVIGSVA